MRARWVSRAFVVALVLPATACTGSEGTQAASETTVPWTWECLKAQPNMTQGSPVWFARRQIQNAIDSGENGPKTVAYYRETLRALRGLQRDELAAPVLRDVPCPLREGDE